MIFNWRVFKDFLVLADNLKVDKPRLWRLFFKIQHRFLQ